MPKRFIVVGLGIFGSGVAEALYDHGNDVIAIDVKDDRVDSIAPRVTRAVIGDARNVDVLERIGARDADAAVVSTGDDLSSSILAVMALRDLGVREIYTKVISTDHARIMRKIGVTETVFPERESSINLALRIERSDALLQYIRLSDEFSMQEMAVPNQWENRTLRELNIRQEHGVSVIAVRDALTNKIVPVPDPDAALRDSDTIFVAGPDENLARVARIE